MIITGLHKSPMYLILYTGDFMKRLFCIALAAIMLVYVGVLPVSSAEVETSAQAYVLYCPDNGELLLSSNPDKRLSMASTTKIMTALITLEHAASDNKTVEFTDEMTAEGSSMYLKVGERVTLDDLAVGMMMQSGNDAANAAAIAIAGSVGDFAALMNRKAAEIGMENTRFVTPSGLDDDGHYSTARDMALLMAEAMENPRFKEITAQTSMTVHFVEPEGKFVTYPNHNKLLRMYESCIGGKTGYTDKSGRCLVTAARRDGMTLIAVTLDDRHDWFDHIALYDYGFESYCAVQPDTDLPDSIDIAGGVSDTVALYTAAPPQLILPRDKASALKAEIYLPAFVYAPVKADDTAGKIIYTADGETVGESRLMFAEDVEYNDTRRSLIQFIKDLLKWH